MITHHPSDERLLAYAAGRLPIGPRLLVEVHLEGCIACRRQVRGFEAIGGRLLEQIEPAVMAPEALARTLERLAHTASPPLAAAAVPRPPLPSAMAWPASLAAFPIASWRWLGPGMRWSRITVPGDSANLILLRIGAGRRLPRHTHAGCEMTQVLLGAFDDGRSVWRAGDFDEADSDVRHQPVVAPTGECICLAWIERSLVFESALARAASAIVGL